MKRAQERRSTWWNARSARVFGRRFEAAASIQCFHSSPQLRRTVAAGDRGSCHLLVSASLTLRLVRPQVGGSLSRAPLGSGSSEEKHEHQYEAANPEG